MRKRKVRGRICGKTRALIGVCIFIYPCSAPGAYVVRVTIDKTQIGSIIHLFIIGIYIGNTNAKELKHRTQKTTNNI
jgi:hypothetical protein